MYYKNRWMASCPDLKPLVSVPVSEIVAIFRVSLELPDQKLTIQKAKELSSASTRYHELFQFEVFTEQSEYPYKDEINEDDLDPNRDQEPQHDKPIKPDSDAEQLDGFKLWDEYQQKRIKESPERAKKKVPHPHMTTG